MNSRRQDSIDAVRHGNAGSGDPPANREDPTNGRACLLRAITRAASIIGMILVMLALGPAQLSANPPGIDWYVKHWAPVHPTLGAMTQAQSGEDWWYDHTSSYLAGHVNGIICAGFSSFRNWGIVETSMGGCLDNTPGTDYECRDFESPGNVRGANRSALALVSQVDGSVVWRRQFAEGAFYRVIQASDGGYVAIGETFSTRDPISGTPLFYNPNQNPGSTTDQFDAGVACAAGSVHRHICVVKVDAAGTLQWHYLYGMVPYRTPALTPQPAAAYGTAAGGAALAQTPDGGFLLAGFAIDPSVNQRRMCLIKIDASGSWQWGRYDGPTDQPSAAQGVAVYGTGPALRYVLSGVEYFPGITFNGYSGSNLFQRALVMQFDGSVSGAPAAPQWVDRSFDVNLTASQNNFDVQIQKDGANTILLPIIVNGVNCLYADYNRGDAKLYRIDGGTGAVVGSVSFGEVTAYDLKIRVWPMADGGFGVVSTKRPACPPAPYGCFGDTRYWATDAYVARCNGCGEIMWQTTIDDPTPASASYPGNVKKQECLYSISQAEDGGFVISGNSSDNFDDSYVMKLQPETPLPVGLYMQDTHDDYGLEPNTSTEPMYLSSDIWVRNNQDDALHSHANQHQNPEYRDPTLGVSNYLYVRVRSHGCSTVPHTGVLKVYCAAASTGLDWPVDWTANVDIAGHRVLGEVTAPLPPINVSLMGNDETIVEIPWFPPNPAGADAPGGHVCILARIETTPVAPYGMTYPEVTYILPNVQQNSRIVWKNVTVVDAFPGILKPHIVGVRNVARSNAAVRLTFNVPAGELPDSLFQNVDVRVVLDRRIAAAWRQGGRAHAGVTIIDDRTIRVTRPGAWIGNILMAPRATSRLTLTFAPAKGGVATLRTYHMNLEQSSAPAFGGSPRLIGGEGYVIQLDDRPTAGVPGRDPGDGSDEADHSTAAAGVMVHCTPNPATGVVKIDAMIPAAGDVRIVLYDALGRAVRELFNGRHDGGALSIQADLSSLPSGRYSIGVAAAGVTASAALMIER